MMEATQMMCDSLLESDEEEHEVEDEVEGDDRGEPLGKLCILKNEHIPEKECLLFLGDNVLGRDPNTCSLPLLAPSVSKQHATISLSVYRRKGCKDEVEALLWDLGSMNGTRKGRLKLTPNVRYALSEGDSLVVADIPCKYMTCTAEVDTRTPVTNNQSTKVSDALRENGGNLNTGKTKGAASSTKTKDPLADAGVTQGTPARTGRLSLEQTPTQQQHGSLVPDSESESDEEKSRVGDRRRQAVVSDSDKSSPTCSTFMSPTNKVVPESEDESPITPSSSYKNRTRGVSFNTEESDADIHGQERKKPAALEIVDDSEEETGNDGAAVANNSNAQPELAKMESNGCDKASVVPQFNMDSDTDVEEEEEKLTTAAPPVLSNNAEATNAPKFHMDSDTDVEDDETDEPSIPTNNVPKNSQVIPVVQPNSVSMDSDTDVEEEVEKPTLAAAPVPSNEAPVISNSAQASNAPEFNMDSDTDVEDKDLLAAATEKPIEPQIASSAVAHEPAKPNGFNLDSDTDVEEGETDINSDVANANGGETPSRPEAKQAVSKPAAPLGADFDSDTDDEGILCAAVSKTPERPDLEILSNSDTDVEDNSPEIQPSPSKTKVAKSQVDGEAGTDVNESTMGKGEGESPAAVTGDSDTDVEESEVPVLQREITPKIQATSPQNCSTPVQPSGKTEGNLEEMETQAFLSPSLPPCRLAASKPGTFSPGLDCQEEDFAVAETQSFILNDRGHDTPPEDNPNVSSDLESSANDKDVSSTSRGHFQLDLSESSILQAQALAMESTQAFVSVNLEETQPYADAVASGGREGPVDIALQATQAYVAPPCSDEESEEDQASGKADQEVDQSVPQSTHEGGSDEELEEATQPVDYLCAAPTLPMCFDNESDGDDSVPVFSKRKAKKIEEAETQQFSSVTMAETLPMEMMEDSASDDESPAFRKRKAKRIEEEETQPNSDLTVAQTQPLEEEATQAMEVSLDEDSDEKESFLNFRKKKLKHLEPMEDTQPSEELTVAPTQPMPAAETEESAGEDSAKVVKKRHSRKQKELAVAPTQPVASSEDVASDEEEDAIAPPRKRKARKLEDTQSLTGSQSEGNDAKEGPSHVEASNVSARPRRGGARSAKEKEETSEEVGAGPQRRQTRGKGRVAPVPKGRRGRAKVEKEDESDTEETQMDSKYVQKSQRGKQQGKEMAAKLQKEEEERKREREQTERKEKELKEREEMERLEKERIEQEEMAARLQKEREEKERMEREEREEAKKEAKEKAEMERLERERAEKEKKELEAKQEKEKAEKEKMEREAKEERERLERERTEKDLEAKRLKEKEEKEKMEREEKERREKEERERLEKERIKKEKEELDAKRKKEKEEKKQKEMLEKRERAERAREEKEQKEREERERMEAAKKSEEELQRQEKERKDKEHKARLEMEEKERLELNTTKEDAPRRGRRAARRTIAVPDSSTTTAVDDVDGPAKRTRSRSNSSNSVGSERSVSSISSQTSRGRGRGRAARKTEEVQAEKTPARGRRRTVATTEVSAPSSAGALENSSLNSEVSSVTSQGRGRGGKQRGKGRRTETEAVNDQVSSQKAPQRGRKSTKIYSQGDEEDQADTTEPSVSTRGQGGAKDQSAKGKPEKDEKEASQEEASTGRRGGRKRPAEADAENESETKPQEENEVDSSVARKTAARKSVKVEVPGESASQSDKPKGKGRASAVQRKKTEEQGDSGSSGNNSMEQEANPQEQKPPQTPKSSVSRKRQSTDSESDSVAKSPRSSTASPSTVGRSRAVGQSYKVLFTGVVDEAGEKVLPRLGGSLAKDVADMNCLVTDKVRRTVKFLCAVAKGIPIVTPQWLVKSGKAGTFLPPNSYFVKDREQENKFNFNLQDSLRTAGEQRLLQGYEIHVTKSVKPEPVHMKDIITSSGAVFLPRMPSLNKPKTLVISCEEDWPLCAPALSCSIPVVSAEFILTGILQQKVDLETHKLSGPASAPGGRGKGRKKT